MLPWISPARNALLLVALASCFVVSTVAFALLEDTQTVVSPSGEQAARADQTIAIDVMRLDRLVVAAPPLEPPALKEILDAVNLLVQAGLIASPADALMSNVASAAVTPANVSEPVAALVVEQQPIPPAAPAPLQAASRDHSGLPVAPPPEESGTVPRAPAASPGTWMDPSFADEVWDAVNALRAGAGLPALSSDGALSAAADAYASDLAAARWFSHTGPDGSTMGDRLRAAGFVNVAAGEVLAMGSGGWPPHAVAQSWLDSPPHRAIILGTFTRAGIACAYSQEDGSLVVRCVMELAA